MTDREPVNIMGVIAFPNPDKDKRVIRFIDSDYHVLFTIQDGESIVITHFDGEKLILPCTYIDDSHTRIGGFTYHIREFAEKQECNGSLYVPAAQKPNGEIGIYEIYQIPPTVDIGYCFRPYAEAKGKLQTADYRRTYAGMFAKDNTLEHLWTKHNGDRRPFARRTHSLSMSDVVVLTQGGKKTAYYADTIGFKEAPEFLAQPQKAKNKRKERGAAR